MSGQTLFQKLWDAHVVHVEDDGTTLLYIDRHLVHEVTSPQAFEGLKLAGRMPRRADAAVAVPDHNVPTTDRSQGITDPVSRLQVETLDANCAEFGITEFKMDDIRQGIVHVIGPEEGLTLPGHDGGVRRFAYLDAWRVRRAGLRHRHVRSRACAGHAMPVAETVQDHAGRRLKAHLGTGVTAKDIALAIIGEIGTAGGTGYALEFGGSAIRALTMEGRMTLCNMAIEAGARAGMVAVDPDHDRLCQGPSLCAEGRGVGAGGGMVEHAAFGCRCPV